MSMPLGGLLKGAQFNSITFININIAMIDRFLSVKHLAYIMQIRPQCQLSFSAYIPTL